MDEQFDFAADECYWDDTPCCPHCGGMMDWAECHMIDCEDGQYDLGEEDPINFNPGTYATCAECDGNGGWWYCPNKACKPDSAGDTNG